MLKRIIAVTMAMCLILTLSGCALKATIRDIVIDATTKIGEEKLITYLKDKYPEKTFTIEQVDYMSLYGDNYSMEELFSAYANVNTVKAAISCWKLTDENGDEYHAIVQNAKMILNEYNFSEVMEKNNSGYASDILDDVQEKEITEAIGAELYRTFGIEESENNFFVYTNALQYSNAKFDGDIVKFLKYKNEFVQGGKFNATYFYNDEKFAVNQNLDKEDYDFLSSAYTIELVQYKQNMPSKEEVVHFQSQQLEDSVDDDILALSASFEVAQRRLLWLCDMPFVEKVGLIDFGVGTEKDKPETWVKENEWVTHKIDDMYYATNGNESNVECKGEIPEDLTDWASVIKTYQEENQEEWENYKAITKKYSNSTINSYFYIDKPQNAESKAYRIFIKKKDGAMLISEVRNELPMLNPDWATNAINGLIDTHIFISSDYIGSCEEWFVIECELKE